MEEPMPENKSFKTSDFDYELPERLIAQTPLEKRDASRLMTFDKYTGKTTDRHFHDIPDLLTDQDCLILNDSRVLPARIYGEKEGTGAHVEFLLLKNRGNDIWETLCGPGRKAKPGAAFLFGGGLFRGEITDALADGNRLVHFTYDGVFLELLDKIGQMPLPHYIKETLRDKERYQTVYARDPGSAAAPTAGLHFTPELLREIEKKGIRTGYVTLHVGLGTFRPVSAVNITDHRMHTEHYYMPKRVADLINDTRQKGGRVIAVGTTSCRTIESVWRDHGKFTECAGDTDIFIYPGYSFHGIDGLITNFHLPQSTLIMLISALAGRENVLAAYREAVQKEYRFFSFGDAMFIS